MKRKILSLVLAVAMMFTMLCVGTVAESVTDDYYSDIEYAVQDYMFIAEFCDGYFEEGGSPSANAIYQNSLWMMDYGDYGGYKVWEDEYGFARYEIPAGVYEENLVFTYFAKTNAIIDKLHSADFYKTDKDEPYYLVETGGGFGGPLPTPVIQCYTERDDGLYEIYALLVETIMFDEEYNDYTYVPTEDEAEGEDYLVIWDEIYTYDEGTDTINTSYGFVYAKITSGLKAVIDVNMGSGYAGIYHAFHKIDKNDIPEGDVTVLEKELGYATVGGSNMVAFVEIDRDVFEPGVTFFGEEYMNDEEASDDMFDTTAELLKDDGVLAGVYEFTASKDGEAVQPNGTVKVKFMLPGTFSPDCAVYYITEDGTVEAIDTVIETLMDDETGDVYGMRAVAELEHFSRYAVAGTLFGDSDGDGRVNIMDVSAMLKSIAKWDVELNTLAIDANRDGIMNLSDVTLVLKYIAGWDVRFGEEYKLAEPDPEPDPEPEIPETPGMEIDGNGVLVKYNGTDAEVVIPEGVTAIGDSAFEDCREITSVVIPDSVTHIGEEAFSKCEALESIVIPDSVTSVGKWVFYRCRGLKSVTVSAGLDYIGYGMFEECTSLASIVIPDSVTNIELGAFVRCRSLTSITIPDGVTSIGDHAFDECDNLEQVILPEGLTSIGADAFSYCPKLSSITIPESVTEIGTAAFRDDKDIVVTCYTDSAAHKYAVENGISYILLDA